MFSAERSAIEIDEETLLEVCHFFNRKDLTLISTVSRRFRDLIHTHLRQTPFLLLPLMYLPPYGEERDTEQLLLVPQLYNSRGPIELDFHSHVGCTYLPDEYFGPTISVSEVITWLNHPSPIEDPSKPRVLKLGYSCLSDSCLTDVRLEKARDIKNRLIELFLNSTQRCSYRFELRHDAYNPSARLDLVRHGLDDCIATNPNTAEQLAVSFKENGIFLEGIAALGQVHEEGMELPVVFPKRNTKN
ncbi:hypothetical protein DdX_21402 [Ditylenchus destructor]|uniref:F-box domain-containing protein n=1 Tax=Ditylenchus destructor TaxID=166010 RepID=A0AAD4MFK5_9BILA|nr:hypothetical protein DdX_21402 [Ditylenchus destructor]